MLLEVTSIRDVCVMLSYWDILKAFMEVPKVCGVNILTCIHQEALPDCLVHLFQLRSKDWGGSLL